MILVFKIFTKGGLVLWCFGEGPSNFEDAINKLVRDILSERTPCFDCVKEKCDMVKYKLDEELGIILVMLSQSVRQLKYADKLLERTHSRFRDLYKNVLYDPNLVFLQGPSSFAGFSDEFSRILLEMRREDKEREKDDNKLNGTFNESFPAAFPSPIRRGVKRYAVFVPGSPEHFTYTAFPEVQKFISSPLGKTKGTRFKEVKDQDEEDRFYMEELNKSQNEDVLNTSSGSSAEPDLPHPNLPPTKLTQFRVAIEKRDDSLFSELLGESPRFLVNTSNDEPTKVYIGGNYNAMHIACRKMNVFAAREIIRLIKDLRWLGGAYGTSACMAERSRHILDAMINTPDKYLNTPLHYACTYGPSEMVKLLLDEEICRRDQINTSGLTPLDVVTKEFRGTAKEKNKIIAYFLRP